jgi:hypothetical protein
MKASSVARAAAAVVVVHPAAEPLGAERRVAVAVCRMPGAVPLAVVREVSRLPAVPRAEQQAEDFPAAVDQAAG